MKKLALLIAFLPQLVPAQSPTLRYTALGLASLDIWQTNEFMRSNKVVVERWNPVIAPFVESKNHLAFTAISLGSVIAIDATIRSMPRKSRDWAYAAWIALEFAATYANSRRAGATFPLMRMKF